MKRVAIAVVLGLTVAATNASFAEDNPGATPPAQKSADSDKKKPADQGVRKLSKRERKERISQLKEEYQEWLIDVEPIIQPTERDAFLVLETDAQRDVYINDFWRRRDRAQGISNNRFRDLYYERLVLVKERFRHVSSDRSRAFLIHGEPQELISTDCDRLLVPLQIWKYFHIPGLGHNVRLLFYQPRVSNDYRLWEPMGDQNTDLAQLVSADAMGTSGTSDDAVRKVFFESLSNYTFISKIEQSCKDGEEILKAIFQTQQNRTELHTVFEPPRIEEEDVGKILRAAVLTNANAPKLTAEFSVRYPAKQGSRTDAEITLLVPRSQLQLKEVSGAQLYSLDVIGEVIREGKLYENFRYRFDFPADVKDEKLPIVIERFLRPNDYQARIKVVDVHSGSEIVLENDIRVPEIFDTPEQRAMKEAGAAAVAQLRDDLASSDTKLRIVPLSDDLLSGLQKIDTFAVGDDIKGVEFYLDGKKVAVKRNPPYTLDLDFGNVPQVRRIRAVAVDAKGEPIAGDEIVVNTGTDPFRVRIVSPRVALKARGKTRVEMSVRIPEGKELDKLELYLNDRKVATLYDEPFVQTVDIPPTEGVGYLRAVATLKDDPTPPIEDVVMINTPQFMEEVNVHLVELPTTVLSSGGKPLNHLGENAFKVLDEGKPVKVAKFEHVKNLPLSIGLAIDTSGSMLHRLNEAQKAGAQFFKNVLRQGDKAFVVSFDDEPQLIQKWSPRVADMNAALAKLRAEEYTALYDAIVFSLYNFLGVKGQKALVLISDGKDTQSKFTYDQTLEYARRTAVPIYAIGIGIRATDVDVRYKLGRFAAETGGNIYYIERAEELGRIYTDIENELRSQYVLGFYPPEGVKPGSKWREVTVQVSEGRAKTIKGYYP